LVAVLLLALQPGADIQVTPVEGSAVQNFGDFESENMAMSEEMSRTRTVC
jgi:hypothetical protein